MIVKLGFGVLMLNEGIYIQTHVYIYSFEITLIGCLIHIFILILVFKIDKNAIFLYFRLSKSHILVSGLKGTAIEVILIFLLKKNKKIKICSWG